MSAIPFSAVAKEFKSDGSWRDIYVLDTTAGDWNTALALVRNSYAHTYFVDGVQMPLPVDVESIFAIHQDGSPLLVVGLDGLTLNCHFFGDDEIEFDLDPREVGEQTFAALIGFLSAVGRVLRRNVFVTHENAQEYPILVYEPARDAVRPIRALADADRVPERGT